MTDCAQVWPGVRSTCRHEAPEPAVKSAPCAPRVRTFTLPTSPPVWNLALTVISEAVVPTVVAEKVRAGACPYAPSADAARSATIERKRPKLQPPETERTR